jgi:carbohydrate diacid regulator
MSVVTYSQPFMHVAETVAQRAASLLAAHVLVTDEHDVVVARADPPHSPEAVSAGTREPWQPELRIPIRIGERAAHVLAAAQREPISPRLAQALVDLVVDQADVVARMPTQDDLRGKLVRDLLFGSVTDEREVMRESQVLGMDLSRPRAVFLIDASAYILAPSGMLERGDETEVCRRAREVIQHVARFFHLPNAAICTYLGDGDVAILKASSLRDLAPWSNAAEDPGAPSAAWVNLAAQKRAGRALLTWLEQQTGAAVAIGVGRHHAGIAGFARSWQDARAALLLGRRLGLSESVYSLDDLGAAAFVGISDQRTKLELAVRLLSPLDADAELLRTLQVFFDQNCSPSLTARRLAIHRNTLSYRLDKIAVLTGLDPRQFDDAMQIRLALILRTCSTEPEGLVAAPPTSSAVA